MQVAGAGLAPLLDRGAPCAPGRRGRQLCGPPCRSMRDRARGPRPLGHSRHRLVELLGGRAAPAGTIRPPAARPSGTPGACGLRTRSDGPLHREWCQSGTGDFLPPTPEGDRPFRPRRRGGRAAPRSACPDRTSLSQRLVLHMIDPSPTPRRNRPPVRMSTSAACLATSTDWRWEDHHASHCPNR